MQLVTRLLTAALLAVITITWSSASQAERRVALIIGNGAYKNVPKLPNPPKDAKAMAALLRNLGFDVTTGTDLTQSGMTDSLRKFAASADNADVALFFYAGHGISLEGKNYLLPVDANLKSEIDVKLGGPIDVNVMLDQTMSTAKVKLVFLDACRDNPFVEQISRSVRTRSLTINSGLAEMKSSEGTLLAFATAPGQTALDGDSGHSPFTTALLDNLGAPNTEISVALTKVRASVADLTKKKQSPWASTKLTGLFYMNQTGPIEAAKPAERTASAAPAAASGGSDLEMEFWRSVKESNKPEELNAYLTRYPDGVFSSIARARVAALNDPKAPISRSASPIEPVIDPATKTTDANMKTEEDVNLDRDQRRDVQRRLKALGFATPVNGKFNDETRRAITNWQSARGYPVSGFLNNLQFDAMKTEALPKTAEKDKDEDEDSGSKSSSRRERHHGGGGGGRGGGAPFIGGGFGPMIRGSASVRSFHVEANTNRPRESGGDFLYSAERSRCLPAIPREFPCRLLKRGPSSPMICAAWHWISSAPPT